MAITLELKPHIQAQLLIQAQANGLPVKQYLENLIESHIENSSQNPKSPDKVRERLIQLADQWHTLPTLDNRTPSEFIEYDELGLPVS